MQLKIGDRAPEFRATSVGGKWSRQGSKAFGFPRHARRSLFLSKGQHARMHDSSVWPARCVGGDEKPRSDFWRERRFTRKSPEVYRQIPAAFPAPIRSGTKDRECLWRLGGKEFPGQEIHGHRANHFCDRLRRPHREDLSEGETQRTYRSFTAIHERR
jgi:hypothetical protein